MFPIFAISVLVFSWFLVLTTRLTLDESFFRNSSVGRWCVSLFCKKSCYIFVDVKCFTRITVNMLILLILKPVSCLIMVHVTFFLTFISCLCFRWWCILFWWENWWKGRSGPYFNYFVSCQRDNGICCCHWWKHERKYGKHVAALFSFSCLFVLNW